MKQNTPSSFYKHSQNARCNELRLLILSHEARCWEAGPPASAISGGLTLAQGVKPSASGPPPSSGSPSRAHRTAAAGVRGGGACGCPARSSARRCPRCAFGLLIIVMVNGPGVAAGQSTRFVSQKIEDLQRNDLKPHIFRPSDSYAHSSNGFVEKLGKLGYSKIIYSPQNRKKSNVSLFKQPVGCRPPPGTVILQ